MRFPFSYRRTSHLLAPKKFSRRWRPTLETLEIRTAPAVFVVTSYGDSVEAVRDGSGLDPDGLISLRSAIMAANDLGGEHTIQIPEGTFSLSIAPEGQNGDESGNLNIGRGITEVTIHFEGAGRDGTVIDIGYLDQGLVVGFFSTVTVRDLSLINGMGGFGGAVSNGGRLTMTDVALRGSGASHGGGLFNSGTATLTRVLAEANGAAQGGGIHSGGTLTITQSTLEGNYGSQGGGLFNAGALTMTRSTIADNYTAEVIGQGGGIFNMSSMTLTNTTIAENLAATGGGIYTFGSGIATLTNCTVAANYAIGSPFSQAGGIYLGIGTPEVRLKNTLIAYNYSEQNADISGAIVSLGTNLISNGTGGSGYVESDFVGTVDNPLDPFLGPLQDNGGPTRTMALLAGSIAINAGDGTDAPNVDQRGMMRDAFIDIGAFEFLEE